MTNHFADYSMLPGRSSVPGKGLVEESGSEEVKSNLHDIAYGNDVFVAIGDAYDYDLDGPLEPVSVYTSTDGEAWTQYTGDWTSLYWKNVVFANGLFLAAVDNGDYYQINTSADGTVWMERSLPSTCSNLSNIVYGNGKFVVAADSEGWQIFTSADGAAWTLETETSFEDGLGSIDRIAFGNGVFVATGIRGTEESGLWCSFDGKNWYSVEFPLETEASYQNVAFGNSFVVLGYVDYDIRRVFTSSNGVSWTVQDWNSRYYFTDAAWGPLNGGTFVISLGYYDPYTPP